MTTIESILTSEDYRKYFDEAIDYSTYKENFQAEIEEGDASPFAQYLPQNWQRQTRLDRKFKLREDLTKAIRNINKPVKWLVITEHWCGDASQINPIIAKVAEMSDSKIDLRFTYRDQNEALIDAHLTDGRSRSIPILLQLDQENNFLNAYGPRPHEAQKLVKSLLADGEAYSIPLHTWYARDKQQALQDDIIDLIQSISDKN